MQDILDDDFFIKEDFELLDKKEEENIRAINKKTKPPPIVLLAQGLNIPTIYLDCKIGSRNVKKILRVTHDEYKTAQKSCILQAGDEPISTRELILLCRYVLKIRYKTGNSTKINLSAIKDEIFIK